jgi:hypothetical protein
MASRISRNTFSGLMRKGLDAAAFMEINRTPVMFPMIFNVGQMTGKFVEKLELGNVGKLVEKPEGEALTLTDMEQGWLKRWTAKTMALGLNITQEAIEDDQYGKIAQMAGRMAAAAPRTMEYDCAVVFNSGDATTYYSTNDSVALFASTHKLTPTGPATFTSIETSAALSRTALQSALTTLNTQKDEKGENIDQTPVYLIVPPALEWKGEELLASVFDPESDSNAVNAVKSRRNLQLLVWKELTSTTSWFILCKEHGLWFLRRMPIQTGQSGDFDTGDVKYKVRCRYALEPWHPRGIIGCYA